MASSENQSSSEPPLDARRWLRMLAACEQRRLLLSTLAGLLVGLFMIIQLGLLAWLVSALLIHESTVEALGWAFAALVLVLGLRSLAQWYQEAQAVTASLGVRRVARAQLLDHLSRQGPVGSGRHSAAIAHQLSEQVEALDGYYQRFLPQLRLAVLVPALVLAIAAWLDWLAALFLLLSAPLIPVFMALVGMGAEKLNRDQFEAVSRLSGHFLDRLRGMSTLQLFDKTTAATHDVERAVDRYRRLSMRTLRVAFLSSAVLEFFASVAIAVVAIYIGFGLLGYIDFGPSAQLTLFSGLYILLLAPEFFQPLRSLAQHYHDRAAALGAAEGLVALLNEPISRPVEQDVAAPECASYLVQLCSVEVSYPRRGRVLSSINLAMGKGETLLITGKSGGGKTTLLRLLAGFVPVAAGRRLIAENVSFAWLGQQPLQLFGSVADNLRIADIDATEAAMWEALAHVSLAELFKNQSDGLNTHVGEQGAGLSGGQAQRLALARVFLSSAPVVLLDEPTASLDEATEKIVIQALAALVQSGRTLIIASHAASMKAFADRLFIMHQGELREVSVG
ncbi:thiol reductant ABC exporter subunit CydD [Halomonas sp. Bachu 37]|uniref:thiol reductant ABC exporter subunit CydD n=1 Tax=Halomonas kashgarensis TaxID=3084920 RepID=UPI003217D2BE